MAVVDQAAFDSLAQRFAGLLDLLQDHLEALDSHLRARGITPPQDRGLVQELAAGLEALRTPSANSN
ncbi:hypothetical protein [Bradyrhizobium sp. SZCCHNS2015]|uniref:hypothetical protein n=1 Tax=Bradyrhizobium sp. SZCCHNS2015 TaxID=3057305 RepID=UPI0028E87951|nr:hypothetical protein [Bradyrhizobium sp. SZCCHNS2015]